MKILNHKLRSLLLAALFLFPVASCLHAQVTIGSGIKPTRAALLDLKTRQNTGAIVAASDADNVSSETGGLLLPRVMLVNTATLEPFVPTDDEEWTDAAKKQALSMSTAGLMVYNITNSGALYPAVYTWNGVKWETSQANAAVSSITTQPQAFTFYELGTESPAALEFVVNGEGDWTYQWYQVTGNNVHVLIGTPIGSTGTIYTTAATAEAAGSKTAFFTPGGVIKGTTRSAGNTGFYRFYCVAKSNLGAELTSNVVEVAVGCGAKNYAGEWISFMCFNLGAGTKSPYDGGLSINEQKTFTVPTYSNQSNGVHTFANFPDQGLVYGELFQWGRIADGHQIRNSAAVNQGSMAATDITTGNRCSTSDTGRPYLQIAKASTTWYGKYVTSTFAVNHNWNPTVAQSTLDQLWRTSRFVQNDPCAHYKTNGTYSEFWHEGTDQSTTGTTACTDAGTGWRAPSQDEWGALYKGGILTGGSASNATANTWTWTGGTGTTNISAVRGFEIKPDGATTTLFLPAGGHRHAENGSLYNLGVGGYYWSTSIIGTKAYYLYFDSSRVSPVNNCGRGDGFPLRCIKNS